MMNANQTNQMFPPQTAQNIQPRFTFPNIDMFGMSGTQSSLSGPFLQASRNFRESWVSNGISRLFELYLFIL